MRRCSDYIMGLCSPLTGSDLVGGNWLGVTGSRGTIYAVALEFYHALRVIVLFALFWIKTKRSHYVAYVLLFLRHYNTVDIRLNLNRLIKRYCQYWNENEIYCEILDCNIVI